MGGAVSISQEAQEGMAKKQSELLLQFGVNFASSFKNALVQSCKDDAEAEVDDAGNTRKLGDAEKPAFPLYEGWVEKSAPDNFRSYRRRYMSVGNEGDNWTVVYKENEDSEKIKGSINCKSYCCERFNSIDREEHPNGGVKLVPCHSWDETARTWYFRTESKEGEDGFYEALREACWKAGPPVDAKEPVIAAAFSDALKTLADSERIWVRFDDYTCEESLSKFIYYVMNRDFLDAEYAKIDLPMGKDAAVKAIKSATFMLINGGVKIAWEAAYAAASAGVAAIKEKVAEQMQPLVDAEAKLLDQIGEITEKTVGAALKTLTEKLFSKTMKTLGLPIGKAMSETVKGFNSYMKRDILPSVKEAAGDVNKLNALQKQADRRSAYYWSGPLSEACARSREIPTLVQDDGAFSDGTGMSVYEVDYMVRGACKVLYRNALAKFFGMVRAGGTDHAAVLAIVTGEMIHDSPEIVQDLYFEIFGECLATNALYKSLISEPITAAVEPIADTIAAIPIVGDLIDLMGTVDKCLETFLQSTMSPSIAECIDAKYLNQDDLIKATGATACH